MHDYTYACLETSYFPNDTAAPAVFGEIASVLQRLDPSADIPFRLHRDVEQAIQELLEIGIKGRRVSASNVPLKPIGQHVLLSVLAA